MRAKSARRVKTRRPKSFFSSAKKRQKTKARICPFIDLCSEIPYPGPDFEATVLSEQYKAVFVQPSAEWLVDNANDFFTHICGGDPAIYDIEFSKLDIELASEELSTSSAAGADGVPASLLNTCRKDLKKSLFILWKSSLQQEIIPTDLLLVLICPVPKGGSRGTPKNYRPVALTSHQIKVFDKVVRKALVRYLEDHGLVPDGKHGFRSFRSTLTQVLAANSYKGWKGEDVIYTDFPKPLIL